MAQLTEFEPMILLLASVLKPQSALYVSGALTSGLRHLHPGADDEPSVLRRSNEIVLTDFAERLRARRAEPVIDPGLLRVRGWCGADYGDFFLLVMEKFALEVHFADDWNYSRGATKEFLYSLQLGIPAFDQRGEPLSAASGAGLVAEAIEAISRSGQDASRMRARHTQIRRVCSH